MFVKKIMNGTTGWTMRSVLSSACCMPDFILDFLWGLEEQINSGRCCQGKLLRSKSSLGRKIVHYTWKSSLKILIFVDEVTRLLSADWISGSTTSTVAIGEGCPDDQGFCIQSYPHQNNSELHYHNLQNWPRNPAKAMHVSIDTAMRNCEVRNSVEVWHTKPLQVPRLCRYVNGRTSRNIKVHQGK